MAGAKALSTHKPAEASRSFLISKIPSPVFCSLFQPWKEYRALLPNCYGLYTNSPASCVSKKQHVNGIMHAKWYLTAATHAVGTNKKAGAKAGLSRRIFSTRILGEYQYRATTGPPQR